MTEDLNAGVPHDERWRFVQAADPALVEALHKAREVYDEKEPGWLEECARYQSSLNLVRQRVPSPHGKDLREAEAAVMGKFEELLALGRVVYAGYPDGKLAGDPQVLPLALLGKRRPRGGRFSVRGVTFHNVKLYPAEAIKGWDAPREKAEAETETAAPTASVPTEGSCFHDLVEIFRDDPNKRGAPPRELYRLLKERNPSYATAREAETVKGWISEQKDEAAKKAAVTT